MINFLGRWKRSGVDPAAYLAVRAARVTLGETKGRGGLVTHAADTAKRQAAENNFAPTVMKALGDKK